MAPQLISNKSKTDEKINLQKFKKVKKTIKDYQKFIRDNFKYVGDNFAYEARSIHYSGKKKSKGIYGSASKKDLRELKEENLIEEETSLTEFSEKCFKLGLNEYLKKLYYYSTDFR